MSDFVHIDTINAICAKCGKELFIEESNIYELIGYSETYQTCKKCNTPNHVSIKYRTEIDIRPNYRK